MIPVLFLGDSAKNQIVAVIAIIEGAVDTADGSRGCTCFVGNFQIGFVTL